MTDCPQTPDASPGPLSRTSTERSDSESRPSRHPEGHRSGHSYDSPQRHHHRHHTAPRQVKETLDARSEYTTSQDDGAAEHKINQYRIKQEIGRGSFGAVHLAVDPVGREFAVKEFSKSRLRKRQQSHVRKLRAPMRSGTDFNSPLHRHPSGTSDEQDGHPLDLIKEEIAIMKKLNHSNLVSLFEVLDDPNEDSLYMVMEMCQKGVIMKVGLGDRADPYDDDQCRCWFRDLILGIEYLHAQGIVHRDIKPDNCLLTNEDVLKVVDFGVSQMFAKDSDMYTAKSAGSPAFLPPELCVVKHGDVSGKAADIWSMGVTLYCLRYGRIPFEKQSIFELYESIKNDEVNLGEETDEDFKDLLHRILQKDPAKRITMRELRDHPWVTKGGTDALLSAEENTAEILEPPTEEEMNNAITHRIRDLVVVMKAANRFKRLLHGPRSPLLYSILGQEHEFVLPPQEMSPEESINSVRRAFHSDQRMFRDGDMATGMPQPAPLAERGRSPKRAGSTSESSRDEIDSRHNSMVLKRPSPPLRNDTSSSKCSISSTGTRGHARSLLQEHLLFLSIGPSRYTGSSLENPSEQGISVNPGMDGPDSIMDDYPEPSGEAVPTDVPVVSESPGASDIDIYETAYREQIERIKNESMEQPGAKTKVFLNRRVESKKHHLTEVLKLVQQDASALHSLQIGDRKPPGSITAGAVVSALTAQLAAKKQKEQQGAGQISHPLCSLLPPSSEFPSVPKEDSKTPLSITIPAASQPLL
ncbi:hypothetical protein Egran_02865 [Elaphomyces granulatus]|uniref:Protein kinase domain-containing protein n=1 Tax=Elaphomyces granulatus TaxID=519963 RepID=A0A232LZ32_9EURO|nr:hypothetical protein Egran_02865 [Elaphomyces granulatus]